MKKIFASLICLALSQSICPIAYTQPIYGLDILGLAKTDIQMVIRSVRVASNKRNLALGVLDGTFGDPYPKLNQAVNSGGVFSVVRLHEIDATCIRNGKCPPGAPRYTDFGIVKKRAQKFESFCQTNRQVKCYISPFLEHDEKDKSVVLRWFNIIKEAAPSATPVCSAFTGWCPPNVLKESHGNTKTGDIISNDGFSIFDAYVGPTTPKLTNYFEQGKVISFAWDYSFNGRTSGEKQFVAPLKRKDWATPDIIQQAMLVMEPQAFKPQINCKDVVKPNLNKVRAEYYGMGKDDGRGNKLLLIMDSKFNRIDLYHIGSTIRFGYLSYYGPFDGGGFRHYIGGRYGSNLNPVELFQKAGNEWVVARTGKGCYLINAIRRLGYYR